MRLYEAHLAVSNTATACDFYTQVVGLRFAHHDNTRDSIFLWAGEDRQSMLGLWGPSTLHGRDFHKSHVAFVMSLPELITEARRLQEAGIVCRNFLSQFANPAAHNDETIEPSVIGWMPSAQIYFEDPDGHSLEFIAVLDDAPDPQFVGPLSEWQKRTARSAAWEP